MYLSFWNGSDSDKEEEQFFVERHGNSKYSHASAYYRKDTSLMDNIKEHLKKGVSVDEVHVELSKENESVSSVSQLVHDPKMIHNLKQRVNPSKAKEKNKKNEGDKLIDLTQSDSFVQTCVFDKDCYSSFNYLPHMLTDLK